MQEPSVRTSRLAIAGGLLAVMVLAGGGFFVGRSTAPVRPAPVAATPVAQPTAPPPKVQAPVPSLSLRRAELLALAARAADALAAGQPIPAEVESAVGSRFELSLPFACSGQAEAAAGAAFSWQYDKATETLRVSARPQAWALKQWGVAAAEEPAQTIAEGFWIARPWTSSEACPRGGEIAPDGSGPITLPGQTLAIAQFKPARSEGSEGREDRAFSIVKRIPSDDYDESRGFVLKINGRIDRVPGGGPVQCIQPAGMNQQPICVIAVRPVGVRIVSATNGETLATWDLQPQG